MADFTVSNASRQPSGAARRRAERLHIGVWIFIGSLVWPASLAFQVGTLNMQIYKFALVALVPLIVIEMARNPIRLRAPDYLMLAFGFLQGAITVYHHGLTQEFLVYSYVVPIASIGWENIGITGLEYLAPYFTARAFIRTKGQLVSAIRIMIWLALGISFFTWIEATTTFSVFQLGTSTYAEQRLGFYRSAGPFPGPIQWGFFASSLFALSLSQATGMDNGDKGKVLIVLLLLGAVFTSLSSAAFMAVALQIGLTAYLVMSARLNRRWLYLSLAVVFAYLFVDVLSNRTPVHVFFSYATLNPWTGYYRLLIWEFGWQNFLSSPLTGIGFNDWIRLPWMTASVDSFWLVLLMRYGLLGTVPLVLTFLTALRLVGRSIESEEIKFPISIAAAWSFSVVSMIVVGFTVHHFGHALIFMTFFLGLWGALAKLTDGTRQARLGFDRTAPHPGA